MKNYKINLIIGLLLILFVTSAFALEIPSLTKRVNDLANILTPQQENDLERLLINYENKTSSQMGILIIKSLKGENLELYSMKVADNWALGQKGLDNGALLLITLKEKKVRIEVGYGLEHILTDLKAKYIINESIVPNFRSGNYFGGINQAFTQMGGLISKEFVISPEELAKYQKRQSKRRRKKSGSPLISIIIFIIFFIFGGLGGSRRRRSSGLGWFFLGSALGGSGRSSGSGFGSGGFGGFSGGGGGFGGGGASGGW